MKQTFTEYAAWKEAVAAAGLVVRIDPPSHEGMHEDDIFEPAYAVDPNVVLVDRDDYWAVRARGSFHNYPTDGDGIQGEGVLFESSDDYWTFINWGDDPMGEYQGRNE